MILSTKNDFADFKADYTVFSTVLETDQYSNEHRVKSAAKSTIHTMWHPLTSGHQLTSGADIAEYGESISSMLYCILYDLHKNDIDYFDVITINDEDYEVVKIKTFNTHTRIDVQKRGV